MKTILRNIWGILGLIALSIGTYLFSAILWHVYQKSFDVYNPDNFIGRCVCGIVALVMAIAYGFGLRIFIDSWRNN